MAPKKPPTRPTGPPSGGARRLGESGGVQRPVSSGAARRAARSKQRSSSSRGWIAVGVVVVVVVALIVFKLTSSSGTPASSGDAAGRNPALAPASIVYPVTHVSDSVFNSVGTDGESTTIFSTTGQSALTSGGLVRFVYFGAEYCPYCAAMRWSVVAALSRFGTFSGLKDTSSGNDDGDIPTFSFLGSTFTSKYLVFTPYEYEDRNQKPLQPVPNDVESLVTKYDFPPYTTTDAEGGIPFLDVGNKYIQAGDSQDLAALVVNGVLANGGPGRQAVANAIADPTSTIGTAISAKYFISEANFISAAVCLEDGGMPGSVCTSPGVKGAETQLVALKPTK